MENIKLNQKVCVSQIFSSAGCDRIRGASGFNPEAKYRFVIYIHSYMIPRTVFYILMFIHLQMPFNFCTALILLILNLLCSSSKQWLEFSHYSMLWIIILKYVEDRSFTVLHREWRHSMQSDLFSNERKSLYLCLSRDLARSWCLHR